MGKSLVKTIFFAFIFGLTGCTSYKIPISEDQHPSSSKEATSQVKLSSLLDLPQGNDSINLEGHDHFEHH